MPRTSPAASRCSDAETSSDDSRIRWKLSAGATGDLTGFAVPGRGAFANRMLVWLCLIGAGAGLALLDANTPAACRGEAIFSGFPGWTVAAAAGSSLRLQIQRRWRVFFGPYPLQMMINWADKIGLMKENRGAAAFLDRLRRAAIEGELEFYGQLITMTGVERDLTKIPPGHLRTCAISLGTSRALGRNEEVSTCDPKANGFEGRAAGRSLLQFTCEQESAGDHAEDLGRRARVKRPVVAHGRRQGRVRWPAKCRTGNGPICDRDEGVWAERKNRSFTHTVRSG